MCPGRTKIREEGEETDAAGGGRWGNGTKPKIQRGESKAALPTGPENEERRFNQGRETEDVSKGRETPESTLLFCVFVCACVYGCLSLCGWVCILLEDC